MKKMDFDLAFLRARAIVSAYPQLILTGSVALIRCGRIPSRPVSDLDFCCPSGEVPKGLRLSKDSNDPHDYLMGVPVNIFEESEIKKGPYVEHIQLWDLDDIERHKRLYGRAKDARDLGFTLKKTEHIAI